MIKWPCGITYETKVVVQNTIVKQPWFNSRSLHYSQAYKPPITRTNQHIILHIKKVTERAPQYHLQRYLWFLNKSIISKRKKYSGFCKILVFLSMEKSLGAIKHPQITYWPFHYCGLNSRFRSFYGLQTIRGSRWDHASLCGRKKSRLQELIKVIFPRQDRPVCSKNIFFHLMQWTPNQSMLHHTFKLKRAVKHVEDRARDKRTTPINVTDCIQSAGSINHVKS